MLSSVLFKFSSILPGTSKKTFGCRVRLFFARRVFGKIGEGCLVLKGATINNPKNLTVGSNSGIGFRSLISCEDKVTLGDRVLMGADVIIYTSNHIWDAQDKTYFGKGLTREPVSIGDDVWLGARTVILPGVTLGRGVTVAAGAVVTKSMPDYVVCGGVPAKIIKVKEVASAS